ncbi:hypothetical protein FB451DRAFT_1166292 [Mycena latifolia]|nr:hypothetical protein FB451DRAFT_1166292 [Mycena latifolia]
MSSHTYSRLTEGTQCPAMVPTSRERHNSAAMVPQYPTSRERRNSAAETSLFAPGLHRIPCAPPTPAALLSGAYTPATDREACLEYFPRRAAFRGRPSLSIGFTVHRQPAPYLKDILHDRVYLDGAQDAVMQAHGWSRTRWVLEWPGYDRKARGLVVGGLTRTALAKAVAAEVALFLREAGVGGEDGPWATRNVHFGDVRLVALNYYGRVWVPVLALDAV